MGPSAELREQLESARAETDHLFRLISPEALYSRPIAERHRLIFYLGHFDTFDWNVLASRALGAASLNPTFDRLFERGIDPHPGEAPADKPEDWPRRDEVDTYIRATRDWIDRHLDAMDPWHVQMAIEHRQMHAETFAYLMHNLPYTEKRGTSDFELQPQPAPANPVVPMTAGTVTLGSAAEHFAWDNERLAHNVHVPAFAISRFKISNGEYLDFVREGGSIPNFWIRHENRWFFRGMFKQLPLAPDLPAWTTWQQAQAYAQWRGKALPSEAQFLRAASANPPNAARDNFGGYRWDPTPVDACSGGCDGPTQMTGNGWEWTRDVFAPFNGFEPHPFYPGYSADFFDGQHYVMKGASPRTAQALTRPGFRNWFRPEYPYMYAGFRLVEN